MPMLPGLKPSRVSSRMRKPALDEILAKRRALLVRRYPVSRFRHVGDGILEQRGVIDCKHVRSVAVRVEHADLVRDREQILFGVRVAMGPGGEPAIVVAARRDGVAEAREGEASVVWQIRRRRIALERTEALCLADVRSRRDHENAEHQGHRATRHAASYDLPRMTASERSPCALLLSEFFAIRRRETPRSFR